MRISLASILLVYIVRCGSHPSKSEGKSNEDRASIDIIIDRDNTGDD